MERYLSKGLSTSLLLLSLTACGGGSGNSSSEQSSRANFTFDCDLNGLNGVLSMDIEAISTTEVVWGGGANPQITGVIGTGGVNYYTAGTLESSTASYVFTGTNDFADFTNLTSPETFRVQWVVVSGGLSMIVNPFGPGPTTHSCVQTSASYL